MIISKGLSSWSSKGVSGRCHELKMNHLKLRFSRKIREILHNTNVKVPWRILAIRGALRLYCLSEAHRVGYFEVDQKPHIPTLCFDGQWMIRASNMSGF